MSITHTQAPWSKHQTLNSLKVVRATPAIVLLSLDPTLGATHQNPTEAKKSTRTNELICASDRKKQQRTLDQHESSRNHLR